MFLSRKVAKSNERVFRHIELDGRVFSKASGTISLPEFCPEMISGIYEGKNKAV